MAKKQVFVLSAIFVIFVGLGLTGLALWKVPHQRDVAASSQSERLARLDETTDSDRLAKALETQHRDEIILALSLLKARRSPVAFNKAKELLKSDDEDIRLHAALYLAALGECEHYEKARLKWLKGTEPEVEKNVKKFFAGMLDSGSYSIDTYMSIVNPIWRAKAETLDEYEEAIENIPRPKEDPYGFWERHIQMVLEETERAREPRIAIANTRVKMYVDEFFGNFEEFGGFSGIDSRVMAVKIISDAQQSKEETIKEYVAALRQHPWPLYDDCGRDYIKFSLFLLQNPEERRGFLERLEAKKKGKHEIKPVPLKIARENVEELFKKLKRTWSKEKKNVSILPLGTKK